MGFSAESDKYNRVGLFLKSRFSYFREESIYYEFRVRYGSKLQSGWRSGSWFIATSKEYPSGEWFWRDDYRRGDLPVNRPNAAVDNEIKALGYLAGYSLIGVIILIVIGIVYCCVT